MFSLFLNSAAMSNIKKVSLELGGKSPLIIFHDCDMDKAVKQVSLWFLSVFFYSICLHGSFIYIVVLSQNEYKSNWKYLQQARILKGSSCRYITAMECKNNDWNVFIKTVISIVWLYSCQDPPFYSTFYLYSFFLGCSCMFVQ